MIEGMIVSECWFFCLKRSAGTAVISHSSALLYTDGRYFLQAAQQLDKNWTLMKSGVFHD